ncbi:MAG TPA: MipA/OmpV family protein [Burkholderiales bacterium]
MKSTFGSRMLGLVCLAFAVQAAAQDTAWRVSVGGGLVSAPKFPGADSQRILALPFVAASYGRFFLGADPGAASIGGVGVNLYRDSHWRLAAALSAGLANRKESDDPRLQGLGDVDRTVSAGVGAVYTQDWFTLRTSVLTDILNRGQGTLVRLDALGRYRVDEQWTLFAGPGLTWANDRYTQTFFGVDADQSAASAAGLPQFQTHAGLNSVRFALGTGYRIDSHWGAGVFGSISRLQGDAAASPITEDKSQYFVGAVVSYRFGNASGFRDSGGFVYGGQ